MELFRKTLIVEAAFNVKSLVTVVDKIRIILERRVSVDTNITSWYAPRVVSMEVTVGIQEYLRKCQGGW